LPSKRVEGVRVDPSVVEAGRVRSVAVEKRAPSGTVEVPADVLASASGTAVAGALLAGRIARFDAREGDHVKRGQVLAWLDAPEATHAVADFVRARARTRMQARKVSRIEGLVASEAATQVALEEARLDNDIARADLAAARTVISSLGLPEPPETGEGTGPLPAIGAQLPIRSPARGALASRRMRLPPRSKP
jgi:multidrug efflux pump subunit AcrA (membrane-fusion protein)